VILGLADAGRVVPTRPIKTTSAWKKRLHYFAAGESYKRGKRPPKGSYWDSVIIKILACPAHRRACSCQYHPSPSLILPV